MRFDYGVETSDASITPLFIVNQLKGAVGGQLKKEFEEFRKLPSPWSGGHVSVSIGAEVDPETLIEFKSFQE